MRQETSLLKQDWTNLVQTMGTGVARLNGAGGAGPGGQSVSKVAPDPTFSNTGQQAIGGNQIFAGPTQQAAIGWSGGAGGSGPVGAGGTGGGGASRANLTDFIQTNPGAGLVYGAGTALMGANATSDMVQAQLLYTRQQAMVGGTITNPTVTEKDKESLKSAMVSDKDLAFMSPEERKLAIGRNFAKDATMRFASGAAVNDKMDASNALAAGLSYGLNGPNYLTGKGGTYEGSFAQGVANASNLVPGMGGEGTMRAAGSMQNARTNNMLKGVGIQIRDDKGNLKPPDQIVDDLWKKICREYAGAYGAGKMPSEAEMNIGFQQGNSMDSLLQNMFGSDPMVYNLIKNGLLFKARTGGGKINAQTSQDAGFTTAAVRAFNKGNAVATQGLMLTSDVGAGAFGATKNILTEFGNMQNRTMPGAVQGLNITAAILQTLGAAGNGVGNNLIKFLTALAANGGKAAGGEVGKQSPYIVGEEGPEVFVPKTDGVIVPNHLTNIKNRYQGGEVGGASSYIVGEKGPELFIPKTDGVIIPNHLLETKNRHEGGGVHGPAHPVGKTYKGVELERLLKQAGFSGKGLEDAIKIVGAESNGRSSAEGDKTITNSKWDYSIGLFQIRSLKDWKKYNDPKREPTHLYDPLQNAKEAFKISNGGKNWGAWRNSAAKLGFIDPKTKKPYEGSGGSSSESSTKTDEELLSQVSSQLGIDSTKLLAAYKDYLKTGKIKEGTTLSSILGPGADATGMSNVIGSAASTYNYGGVTFNMNVVGGDPKKLESMFKSWFEKLKSGNLIGTN